MNKKLLALALPLLAAVAVIAQPTVGERAYEISLPDVKGAIQKLSDHKGKVVLIDFWASWCGPCRKANPALSAIYTKYKDKGFEIFGVSIDDEKKAWRKAIQADGISWKQVNGQGGWEAPVALAWKLEQIPASYLIDQQGRVIAIDPTKEDIENHLKNLLK
ncbi:MAG TPA: TlpA disulfide reductase family protein [Flavitalea sp.]|nr:TlpA disulfide reductase family protein [Flavitalea sp.]